MRHTLRWRLAIGGVLAAVMVFGLAAPAIAAVTDVFYGIRGDGWIESFDPVTGDITQLIDVAPPLPATGVGPNGLGFDEVTNRLYYAEYPDQNGDGKADLYFTDLDDAILSETYSGQLPGWISNADIYNGVYYYIDHGVNSTGTDDFYAVTFNTDGTVNSVTKVGDIANNAHRWTFNGDVAVWEGVLYGWGDCTVSGHPYEFFKVNLDGTGFTLMDTTLGGYALQLAFASDGTLYGHNYNNGYTYRIAWDAAGNVTATFLRISASHYTDTASGSTGSDVGYSLTGSKWYDRDKDGVWDEGEQAIERWKISLLEGEPNPADATLIDWVPMADTLTAADGSYAFSELEPGLYKVEEGPASGCWSQTYPVDPAWYEREIVDSGFEALNFGNVCEETSTGGYTLGYWSNKNGQAALATYNVGADEVSTWQAFLDEYNLVDKVGETYDPSIDGAFRTWLLKADATNMSYMLSVQMTATLLNIEIMGADYVGYGVLWDGEWMSIAALIEQANAFLFAHPETLADDVYRPEAEAYKNLFDALNNNMQVLIPHDPCPVPNW